MMCAPVMTVPPGPDQLCQQMFVVVAFRIIEGVPALICPQDHDVDLPAALREHPPGAQPVGPVSTGTGDQEDARAVAVADGTVEHRLGDIGEGVGRHFLDAVAQRPELLPPPDEILVHHPPEALLILFRRGDRNLFEGCGDP